MIAVRIDFELESNSDVTKSFNVNIKKDGITSPKDLTKSTVHFIAYSKTTGEEMFRIKGDTKKEVGKVFVEFTKDVIPKPVDLSYELREVSLQNKDSKLAKGDLGSPLTICF